MGGESIFITTNDPVFFSFLSAAQSYGLSSNQKFKKKLNSNEKKKNKTK